MLYADSSEHKMGFVFLLLLLLTNIQLPVIQAVTPVGILVTEYQPTGTSAPEMPKSSVQPAPEPTLMTATFEMTGKEKGVIIETSSRAAILHVKPTPTSTASRFHSSSDNEGVDAPANKSVNVEYENSSTPFPTMTAMEVVRSSEYPSVMESDISTATATSEDDDDDEETTPIVQVTVSSSSTKMQAGDLDLWASTETSPESHLNYTVEIHDLQTTTPFGEIEIPQEETSINGLKGSDKDFDVYTTTTFDVSAMTAIHIPNSSTESSSDIHSNHETSESGDVPRCWFVLVLEGNCTVAVEKFNVFSGFLVKEVSRRLKLPREATRIVDMTCGHMGTVDVNMTVILARGTEDLQSLLDALENSKGPLITAGSEHFYVNKIRTREGLMVREPDLPPDREDRHADVETIVYVALGSTCAFLILLALALLFCKYCEPQIGRKQIFLRDLHDPPVRLEDYTLTRIPRPRMSYSDYCRGRAVDNYYPLDEREKTYGVMTPNQLQPFETSVVPLQDARILEGMKGCGSSSERVAVRPAIFRVEDHQNSSSMWQSEECVGSTENLQQPAGARSREGVDNPNFY